MNKHKLNFSQAMGWDQPEIVILLLDENRLQNILTLDLLLLISTYLQPNTLCDALDLANKVYANTISIVGSDSFFKDLKTRKQMLSTLIKPASQDAKDSAPIYKPTQPHRNLS